MRTLLVDTCIYPFQLVEGKDGMWVVRGVFGVVDKPTGNKRVYPKALMKREIDRLQKFISDGMLYGEAEHPPDGKTQIPRVSHRITKLGINDEGWVIGEAIVLDTPYGMIVKEMLKSGGKVGVSSRGFGSVVEKGGLYIVQDDFSLVTYDFVANPSVENAVISDYSIERLNEDLESLGSMTKKFYFTKLDRDIQKFTNGEGVKNNQLNEVLEYLSAVKYDTDEIKRLIAENNDKFREIIRQGNDRIAEVLIQLFELQESALRSKESELSELMRQFNELKEAYDGIIRKIGDINNIDLVMRKISSAISQIDELTEQLNKTRAQRDKLKELLTDAVRFSLKRGNVEIGYDVIMEARNFADLVDKVSVEGLDIKSLAEELDQRLKKVTEEFINEIKSRRLTEPKSYDVDVDKSKLFESYKSLNNLETGRRERTSTSFNPSSIDPDEVLGDEIPPELAEWIRKLGGK